MAFKHPHRYGLMAMVSKKDYKKFKPYRDQLEPYTKFFMEPHFFDDIAPQHISICYFSYPEKYPKEFVKKLISKIETIVKKNLPLTVEVQGLMGWWELNLGAPAVLWNITDFGKIQEVHDQIIEDLKRDVEHFNDPEMDFTPHIGVAVCKNADIEKIKEIVEKSKKDEKVILTIDSFYIFFPEGAEEIFRTD